MNCWSGPSNCPTINCTASIIPRVYLAFDDGFGSQKGDEYVFALIDDPRSGVLPLGEVEGADVGIKQSAGSNTAEICLVLALGVLQFDLHALYHLNEVIAVFSGLLEAEIVEFFAAAQEEGDPQHIQGGGDEKHAENGRVVVQQDEAEYDKIKNRNSTCNAEWVRKASIRLWSPMRWSRSPVILVSK